MFSYCFSELLTLSLAVFCMLFPIQSRCFCTWATQPFALFLLDGKALILSCDGGHQNVETAHFFVEGLQGLWHSRMIGCGYQDPQCSTVALNLTLVEVMWFLWHFSGLLWVHCYVFPRDCNSSSWKSLTNGPRDCWHSSQPVLDWCCLQPVLPRGLEVFSPNSDLFLPWDICWGGYTLFNSYW